MLMDARRFAALPDPFPMWRGGVLHGARIAYETVLRTDMSETERQAVRDRIRQVLSVADASN